MAALLIAMLLFLIFRGLAPFNPLHKLADWTPEDTTRTDIQVGGQARLLSAFFGLDSSFPWPFPCQYQLRQGHFAISVCLPQP